MVDRAWRSKSGELFWWVAPSYRQSQNAFDLMKRMLPDGTYKLYQADLKIAILSPRGSEKGVIEFKSGDNPDTLRGFGVTAFVLDEAARVPYESWVSLRTTVTQTMGKGIIISTPKGRGWFYDQYQWGVKYDDEGNYLYTPENPDPHPEWYSICMPTWANPTVRPESVDEMRRSLPEDVFQQEVAAKFLLDSAGVFRGINGCVKGFFQAPRPDQTYVMGVDLARLKDYTVLTVMSREQRHVVSFERSNKTSWEDQYQRIIATARKYRADVVVDSTGLGDPICETLQRAGVRVFPYKISGSAPKIQLIDKLRVNIEQQRISYPNIPVLRSELEAYEVEVTESGVPKYGAPSGKHDDCVISLALANWGLDTGNWGYRAYNIRGV